MQAFLIMIYFSEYIHHDLQKSLNATEMAKENLEILLLQD
jgi:hypothetical protein